MQPNPFVSLAIVQLPSPVRVLRSSWCPDKDLLVIITRLGGKDRLSLWKMQGAKKWEVDLDPDGPNKNEVVAMTWSPDAQTIAIAHEPAKITLHSIQDGHQERAVPLIPPLTTIGRAHLTGIWWFSEEKKEENSSIPDIFKRGSNITGSAHSILKGQALLDPLQDESQPLTATDLFAFQGKRTAVPKITLPPVISSWPTLPSDPTVASIKPSKVEGQQSRPGEDLDQIDDSNVNSLLVVSDHLGYLHCFLDGCYAVGSVSLGFECSVASLYEQPGYIFAHSQSPHDAAARFTNLRPTVIELPQLRQRMLRDVARTSTSVRELVWYTMRVVKDMRAVWFGSDTNSGARTLGPKWIQALEARQKDQYGQEEPHAMLDLTRLLTTGRFSDSLSDYLGSAEQMSERGVQKWESTVSEALRKLRDYSEKRVAPACQRIHLLLEEVKGWSMLARYVVCGVNDVHACLQLASRAIVLAGWLAATARRELVRFKEFINWIKYEISRLANANDHNHSQFPPKHDILEVNDYLMAGLVVSPIDKWFMGPVPRFSPHDLGVPGDQQSLTTVIQRARSVINNPAQMAWPSNVKQKDLSHLDRNLDSLIQELATRCSRIFVEAASATARSAAVVSGPISAPRTSSSAGQPGDLSPAPLIRERTVRNENEVGSFWQYLAIQLPRVGERSYCECVIRGSSVIGRCHICSPVCLARLQHAPKSTSPLGGSVALVECCVSSEGENEGILPFDLLDAEFFDDNTLVVVYRIRNRYGPASIATVGYRDLIYEAIELNGYVNDLAREVLMLDALQRLSDGQLTSVHVPIIQSRVLSGCAEGSVTLSVNGRVGRRVACVLDSAGGLSAGAGSDDSSSRMSEAALRKKKNADAQAAFRARRANYIATLEETVTNLEAVVIQLQDSCRSAKNEAAELREQNLRLKQDAKQRERLLRKLLHGKGVDAADMQGEDFPPAPPYSVHPPSAAGPSMSPAHTSHYTNDALRYTTGNDQSASMAGASYHHANGQDYSQRSPALTFAGSVDGDASGEGRSQHLDSHRIATRYDQYSYSIDGSTREGPWAGASDPGALDSGSSSHSPSFVESPSLTSADLSYSSRFPVVEDQKIPLPSLGSSSYIFPTSRSLSPAASTPTSASSTSLAPAPFQFTFPEGSVVQDRPEFNSYRRHNHGPELTLHGGTADISSLAAPGGDALRYRLNGRTNPASDRPMAQAPSPYSRAENGSGGRESDESESASYTYSTRSRQRSGVSSARASRSPSPGPPPICGTLAVIKAQAFGALRRTRTRTKKSSEGAAKAAVEALEARGIGMGISVGSATKRPRLHSDDGDLN
ncbi:anaphase-promoting complex, cyclosome, subunit 4-domain-containing protein [Amylocystis lapponica]|nr:anaphase-promoting complex, cyclosome, subunit 4-domain-containing protein [Amylocystis lapponica]